MNNGYCYETKIGKIIIMDNGSEITHIHFGSEFPIGVSLIETALIKKAYVQLEEYFEGKRKTFELPLAAEGTQFQQKVWQALKEIPYGKTCSYKAIAEAVGNVKACRAVGMANNRNPIPIIVPCHRVVGADGKLVGYAGGLDIKEKLLEIERQNN